MGGQTFDLVPPFTDEERALFHDRVGGIMARESELISITRIPGHAGEILVFVYHEHGSFTGVTERVFIALPGGGGAGLIGAQVKPMDMALLNADAERRAKIAAETACKHLAYEETWGYWCSACDSLTPAEDAPRGYECSSCGTSYVVAPGDPRNCPSCNRFGAKVADHCCTSCEQPIEDETPGSVLTCTVCGEAKP